MIRRPPRSTLSSSSAASDVYKRQEYGRAPLHVMALTEKSVAVFRADFDEFDVDQSGFIEWQELPSLLSKQLGRDPTGYELDATLQLFDTNKDGQISFSEYMENIVADPWKAYVSALMQNLSLIHISEPTRPY
eukprot:TRINITY_DN10746_c0_g1_i3.p1 TRINITY_DN10746_c0_g1~~TRINITY_DN10746_c0_g1_i3.p1  ORF type:complete len:133 (+),score=38.94 TRINITY_DN10746_c0_g1_i3:93-491(+)